MKSKANSLLNKNKSCQDYMRKLNNKTDGFRKHQQIFKKNNFKSF